MTWMQRFACEMQKSREHAFSWLLNAVMKPWRDAGLAHFQQKCARGFVSENAQIHTFSASNPTKSGSDFVDDALAKDLLANAFALKEYRWMVRFAEEMLRGVIRAQAAAIKFYEVNPPEPVRQRSIPKIPPIRPIRGDFYFRMREAPPRGATGPQGRMRANGPRKSPDLNLTGLRLMLRAQAVETALYQAKRYAWRYARAQARQKLVQAKRPATRDAGSSPGLAHFQQKCRRGFVPENAQIQTSRPLSDEKPGFTFFESGLANFQQKCRRGFVSENAQIQTSRPLSDEKPGFTFSESGLAHFQQKCGRGFVPENAQIRTFRPLSDEKPGFTFSESGLALAGGENGANVALQKAARFRLPSRKDPPCAPPSSSPTPAPGSPNPSAAASIKPTAR